MKSIKNAEQPILITVPYAGGSSAGFVQLTSKIRNVTAFNYDYPGHGRRVGEEFAESLFAIAEELAKEIVKLSPEDQKFYILGHSMGAIVAFYCESLLEQEYQLSAERIFLSACLPPEKFYENRIMFKTEEELYNYLRESRKIPEAVMNSPIFQKNILEQFKQDIRLIKEYIPLDNIQITAPVTCFCGSEDDGVEVKGMAGWRAYTKGSSDIYEIPGDHFFIESNAEMVVSEISRYMNQKKRGVV